MLPHISCPYSVELAVLEASRGLNHFRSLRLSPDEVDIGVISFDVHIEVS